MRKRLLAEPTAFPHPGQFNAVVQTEVRVAGDHEEFDAFQPRKSVLVQLRIDQRVLVVFADILGETDKLAVRAAEPRRRLDSERLAKATRLLRSCGLDAVRSVRHFR